MPLLLLFALHALDDFVLRRTEQALRPRRSELIARALLFVALPLALLTPLDALLTSAYAVYRTLLRLPFARLLQARGPLLSAFALEQLLCIAALLGLAALHDFEPRLSPVHVDALRAPLLALIVLTFQVGGGAFVVTAVLQRYSLSDAAPADEDSPATDPAAARGMGRAIGVLERLLAVLLAFEGAWAGLGMILAAKSIARFKDLEHRHFAEYYLIGTLTSYLVATTSGLAWIALRG